MSVIERADKVLASSTGQTVGWILILAIALGSYGGSGSDGTFLVIVLALGLSWILGASYGRRQAHDRTEEDGETE